MTQLSITEIDREAIAEALSDPTIDERKKRKLLAIKMHALNVPNGSIAKTLNISNDTLTHYLKLYQDQGLPGIFENRYYQPTSQVNPFLEILLRLCLKSEKGME